MYDALFYLISSFVFILITKGFMDMFFVKKDMSYLFMIFIWCGFYVIEGIVTSKITIPIVNLIFEIGISFVLCLMLYEGSARKKVNAPS